MNNLKQIFLVTTIFSTAIISLASEAFVRRANVQVIECNVANQEFFKRIDSIVNITKLKTAPIIELSFLKYLGNNVFSNSNDSVFREMCGPEFSLDSLFAIFIYAEVIITPEMVNQCVVPYKNRLYVLPRDCLKQNLIVKKRKKIFHYDYDVWLQRRKKLWHSFFSPYRYVLCTPEFQMNLLPKNCLERYIFESSPECEETI